MGEQFKKIGIITFGDKHGGGVYQYTHSLVDALSQDMEHEYVIFADHKDTRFDDCGLQVRKLNKFKKNFVEKILKIFLLYAGLRKPVFFSKHEKDLYSDIDFFISPSISDYPHFYLNKPFIFTLHDLQERYYRGFFTFKEKVIRKVLNVSLSKRAERILCESDYVKNDIVKFLNVSCDRISVVQAPPPSVLLGFEYDENEAVKVSNKYKLPKDYLFYPAQFWYHKNHLKLLDAFKILLRKHEGLHLVLTGAKQNNYDSVVNKIKELGIEEYVSILGYVDYLELAYLYKLSKMLVMPTLFESVSIPVYEAFALKVHVCCSNVVALPEQVGDAGLLFDPNDAVDMAEKVDTLISNEELSNVFVERGFRQIANFDHENYRTRLLKAIRGCC